MKNCWVLRLVYTGQLVACKNPLQNLAFYLATFLEMPAIAGALSWAASMQRQAIVSVMVV